MLYNIGSGLTPQSYNSQNNGFTPESLSNLGLWLDAQNLSSISFSSGSGDGGLVGQWGPSNSDGTYGAYTASPTYPLTYLASGIQSKPAIRKNSPYSILNDDGNGTPAKYGMEVTIIIFFTKDDASQLTGDIFTFNNTSARFWINDDNTLRYYKQEGGTFYEYNGGTTFSMDQNLTMFAISYTDESTALLKVNDLNPNSFDPYGGYWYSDGGFRLGGRNAALKSPIVEFSSFILYNRALTNDELNQIYAWGADRYGA